MIRKKTAWPSPPPRSSFPAARLTSHHHQFRVHCRGDTAQQLERRATRRATFRDLRPPGRQHAPENRSDESAFSFLGDAGDTPPPSKPSVSATDRGTTAGPVSDRGVRDVSLLSGPVADSAPTKRLATTAAERPRPPPATPVAMQRARRRACSR